jgi:quercetin dioxygenase-like cupin family protein
MIRTLTLLAALAAASTAAAQAPPPGLPPPPAITTPLKSLDATSAGQPIVMPSGPLRVTVSQTVISPLSGLPPHKHPYPRYVYVLEGQLRVTNLVTGQVLELKAGDMTIDPIDQWHEARVTGPQAVRLITIDQAPPGAATTVRRDP